MAPAGGYKIRWSEDAERVVGSIVCFVSFFAYGAIASSLGAALPSFSEDLQSGFVFTLRGVGFFVGTIISAAFNSTSVSKSLLTAACLLLSGITTGLVALSSNYYIVLLLFGVQGIGFGGVDTFANCSLPELWETRVGPWMQALHAFFGLGAIIGPAIVGLLGFRPAFIFVFIISTVPLLGLLVYTFFQTSPSDDNKAGIGGTTLPNDKSDFIHQADDEDDNEHEYDDKEDDDDDDDDDDVEVVDFSVIPLDDDVFEASAPSDSTDPLDQPPLKPPLLPLPLKLLVTIFYFIYTGTETVYAGWIPTLALKIQITSSISQAAYLSSYFWLSLTVGRVLAVPSAVYFSATAMYRFQGTFSLVTSFCMILFVSKSYTAAVVISMLMGFGLSSIYPLMMTIVGDYGYAMDANTTAWFVAGACMGESVLPVLGGWVMTTCGAAALSWFIIASQLIQMVDYIMIDNLATVWSKGGAYMGGGEGSGERSGEGSRERSCSKETGKREIDGEGKTDSGLYDDYPSDDYDHGNVGIALANTNGRSLRPSATFNPLNSIINMMSPSTSQYTILNHNHNRGALFDSEVDEDMGCGIDGSDASISEVENTEDTEDTVETVDAVDASFVTVS